MMKTMSYSIITSAYNQLEKLKRLRLELNKQTNENCEWIIAEDGSNDGTEKWAKKNADKYVRQDDMGYRLTKILNKASEVAEGHYYIWIMADSFPNDNFIEIIDKLVNPDTLATGLRLTLSGDKVVSDDWRIRQLSVSLDSDEIVLKTNNPWTSMTLNSMIMPADMYDEMGGIDEGYDKGYGRMDWWIAMWAHYNGYKLSWYPKALIFHDLHDDREDTQENIALFEKHYQEFNDQSY